MTDKYRNSTPVVQTDNVPFKEQQRQHPSGLVVHEETWLKNITSKQTQRTYATAIKEICTQLGVANAEQFRALNKDDIIEYRDYLIHERELSNRSVRNRLAAISSCFQYLQEQQVVGENPVNGVERPKVDETVGETPSMSNAQVKKFLAQPDVETLKGARDAAILHFLFYTGSRIGAPGTIRVKDFYQDDGFYVLKWRKKGGKNQVSTSIRSFRVLYFTTY